MLISKTCTGSLWHQEPPEVCIYSFSHSPPSLYSLIPKIFGIWDYNVISWYIKFQWLPLPKTNVASPIWLSTPPFTNPIIPQHGCSFSSLPSLIQSIPQDSTQMSPLPGRISWSSAVFHGFFLALVSRSFELSQSLIFISDNSYLLPNIYVDGSSFLLGLGFCVMLFYVYL